MPSRTLTAAAVERIKPPKTGQEDHFDRSHPGLVLRCSYAGAKSWSYLFRLYGRQSRMTLGRWPAMTLSEARDAWRDAHKLVTRGENPIKARPAAADTFAAVAAEWIKRDQEGNRTAHKVERAIERTVMARWRDRQISSITRRDALEAIDTLADRGTPIAARRLHAHLHRMFQWALGRGIIAANPMAALPKPGKEVARDRVLSDDELVVVWRACDVMGWPFGPLFRLLALTGARQNEIASLRWSEIHGDLIRLEGARTKNGQPHNIPLSPQALALVDGLPHIGDSDWVFTTTGATPVSGWSKAKAALDKAVILQPLPEWHIHDLRRTVATGLQKLGFSLQVIEAVLGHVSGSRSGIVGVYQRHSFDPEKRQALDAWARHVEQIVSGKPAAVLPMTRRR
jgi:integrase